MSRLVVEFPASDSWYETSGDVERAVGRPPSGSGLCVLSLTRDMEWRFRHKAEAQAAAVRVLELGVAGLSTEVLS